MGMYLYLQGIEEDGQMMMRRKKGVMMMMRTTMTSVPEEGVVVVRRRIRSKRSLPVVIHQRVLVVPVDPIVPSKPSPVPPPLRIVLR